MATPEICEVYAQYLGARIDKELAEDGNLEGILSNIKVCRSLGQITSNDVNLLCGQIIILRPQSEERLKKELGL